MITSDLSEAFSLTGKKILVTGASSGIGKETAILISKAGATVFISGRDHARLDETFSLLERIGHQVFTSDLTDMEAIAELTDKLPALDGIVHSAGITGHVPAKFIQKEDIDSYFSINYQVPVLLTAQLLKKKKIQPGASIVFLSSVATKYPYFGGALYSGTKAALEAYSRVLSVELAPKGIRSNCVSPSFVRTAMVEKAGETISNEVLEKFERIMPLGFGTPDDVAKAILYLLSDAAKWVTGSVLQQGGS